MTKNGPKKYYRCHYHISDKHIHDHLHGYHTLACQFQRNGKAYIAAADIDDGGPARLRDLLAVCSTMDLWAFAIAVRGDKHDGGHLFIPFANEQDAGALQSLVKQIAGAEIEAYPSGADLRLPFGKHQRVQSRGTLLFQDGTTYDLDTEWQRGVELLTTHWKPNTQRIPTLESMVSASPPTRTKARTQDRYSIATGGKKDRTPSRILVRAILDHFDIEDILERYGAKCAGRNLYYCPFHDDRHPSLVIYHDRNQIKVCRCMSRHSGCLLSERGRNDVINVVAIAEGLSTTQAIHLLAEELRRDQPQLQPSPTPAPPRPQPQQPPQATEPPQERGFLTFKERQEKRQQALLSVMCSDLPPCAKTAYKALDAKSLDRGWCAISVSWLAQQAKVDERTIQRGLRALEKDGYLRTYHRYGHVNNYVLFWLPKAEKPHGVIERSPNMLVDHDHACEGGHDSAVNISEHEVNSTEEPESFDWTTYTIPAGRFCGTGKPKQKRFITREGNLYQRFQKKPQGELPEPALHEPQQPSTTTLIPFVAPSGPPVRRGSRRSKRKRCPPSQVPRKYRPWGGVRDPNDPWWKLQRYLLEKAEQEGNQERIAFYRSILDGY